MLTHTYVPAHSPRTITQNWIQLLGTLWPTTSLILQLFIGQHKLSDFPIRGICCNFRCLLADDGFTGNRLTGHCILISSLTVGFRVDLESKK